MKIIRRIIVCLVVGGFFGWVMSTKFPTPHALVSGAAAGAFMYGGLAHVERVERREMARRAEEPDEHEEG